MSFDGPHDRPAPWPGPSAEAPTMALPGAERLPGTERLPMGEQLPGAGRPPAGGPASRRGGPAAPRRRRLRSRPVAVAGAAVAVLAVAGAVAAYVVLRPVQVEDAPDGVPAATGRAASLPAGRTWPSGAWTGGGISVERIDAFGTWRGQPADVVTTYPAYQTWTELKESDWHVGTLDAFHGRISYGLPLLPKQDGGSLADVAAGRHDDVWRAVGQIMNDHHRGDTFVRIGLEANGTWFPWGATAARADEYRAAWRHVQSVLKSVSPKLSFGFDITCGSPLEGGGDRMDNLNRLYPGDDVVDVVGCDHYDSYGLKSRNGGEWERTLRPPDAAGLADVADFARAHHKQFAVPEWGMTSTDRSGSGDNPFFIYQMYGFFQQNKDILAYENYFNEMDSSLGSAVWDSNQNPRGAAEYRKLWGAPAPNLRSPASRTP